MYMTTENVETREDRSLSELLTLDTYQGMTDTEIETLIQERIRHTLAETITEEKLTYANELMETVKLSTDMRNRALLNVLQLHEVRPIVYASSYMEGNENG